MREPGVGEARRASARACRVVGDDRLAGEVAAGHHQHPRAGRVAGQPEQQVVHRRVGEHDADVGVVRAPPRAPAARPARRGSSTTGRRGSVSSARSAGPACGERPRVVDGRRPSRRTACRRGPCACAASRRRPRRRRRRPGGSRRCPSPRRPRRRRAGAAPRRPRRAPTTVVPARPVEPQRRPAVVAGDGLGMEAAVGRVGVLGRAPRAQRQVGHRRVGPVVGQRGHDGEARAAVRAADERVPVAAVGRVGELGQAVVAGGDVGRDQGAPGRPRRRWRRW